MVLINPEVTDEALTAAIDEVGGYISNPGAEITYIKRDTPWGRRRLAYPIQRFRDATYVLFQFLASPSTLTDIERELKLDERIIRYLLIRQDKLHTDEEDQAPAALSQEAEGAGNEGDLDEEPEMNDGEPEDVEESVNENEDAAQDEDDEPE